MDIRKLPKRLVKRYLDHGFGFPVVIQNVQVAVWQEEEIPLIDYRQLEQKLVGAMPDKAERLTGAEVRFIRRHFAMTLEEFGRRFGVSHAAVKKWEDKGDKPTAMAWATEKDLRLFVSRRLGRTPKHVVSLYDRLQEKRRPGHAPVIIPKIRPSASARPGKEIW